MQYDVWDITSQLLENSNKIFENRNIESSSLSKRINGHTVEFVSNDNLVAWHSIMSNRYES